MHPDSLREFLDQLEQTGQLARIAVTVDPSLELATIVNQVCKRVDGGPALWFERVKGTRLAVAANLFGSQDRVALALGTNSLDALVTRFAADLQASGEREPQQALVALTKAPQWQPKLTNRPGWQFDAVRAARLALLPAITAWPNDGGPFLTLAQVVTRHPDGGSLNCGMYRVQVHDEQSVTLRCRQGSGAERHLLAWHERDRAMPVAIALGGPPVLTWAAGVSLPAEVEEAAFCGYLTGSPLLMGNCQTSDLQVPASAEIVIEGTIAPGATRTEGPFGNHTGTYDRVAAAPEVKVESVQIRNDAIYPWTLVGPPPMENLQLARAATCLLLPLLQMVVPTVRALHMPAEGAFHRAALITVDSSEQRPFAELANLLWNTLLLKGSRLLVIGAADHDPHDPAAVFWRALNRVDWAQDLLVEAGCLAVDARRLPPGGLVRPDAAVLAKVLARWREYRIDAGVH